MERSTMLLMGKSPISMVIFNSYVKLPEGIIVRIQKSIKILFQDPTNLMSTWFFLDITTETLDIFWNSSVKDDWCLSKVTTLPAGGRAESFNAKHSLDEMHLEGQVGPGRIGATWKPFESTIHHNTSLNVKYLEVQYACMYIDVNM